VASLSQGRTAAAQCGLFTHKSVPVIFEPPCIFRNFKKGLNTKDTLICMAVYIYLCTYITYLHLGILRGVIPSGSQATLCLNFLTLLNELHYRRSNHSNNMLFHEE